MRDVVLPSVYREDVKPRRYYANGLGIGSRPSNKLNPNLVERKPGNFPPGGADVHVVRLGGGILSGQFVIDLNEPSGHERRHQVHRLVVPKGHERVAHLDGSKAGGIGNHFVGAAVAGRAERVGRVARDAGRHSGVKGDGVAGANIRAKTSVRTTVGAAQGGTTQALLDGVDPGGIVDPKHRTADIGVGGAVDAEVSVGVVNESDDAGQDIGALCDGHGAREDSAVGDFIGLDGRYAVPFNRDTADLGACNELLQGQDISVWHVNEQVTRDDHDVIP